MQFTTASLLVFISFTTTLAVAYLEARYKERKIYVQEAYLEAYPDSQGRDQYAYKTFLEPYPEAHVNVEEHNLYFGDPHPETHPDFEEVD